MFEDVRARLNWAVQRIESIPDEFCKLQEGDAYQIIIEPHTPGMVLLRYKLLRPLPSGIPFLVGDAIHNLRASLDNLAIEIVTLSGGSPTKQTGFPVGEDRQRTIAAIEAEMERTPTDIVAIIADIIQPYPGGKGAAIYALHKLDILDKHYQPANSVRMSGIRFSGSHDGLIFKRFEVLNQNPEMEVMVIPEAWHLDGEIEPAFAIFFDKGQPFEGHPVVETLQGLSQTILGAIEAIEVAAPLDWR